MQHFLGTEYISIGGNRHRAAADWSSVSQVLAFGADQNVALWTPLNESHNGIDNILRGHTGVVNAVRFFSTGTNKDESLISGSADGEIRIWRNDLMTNAWTGAAVVKAHEGAVNCLAVLKGSSIFVSGGADMTIRIWKSENGEIKPISTINPKPRFIPLALVLGSFGNDAQSDSMFLAASGTRNDIQVYSLQNLASQADIKLCATLTGHEGWIGSLSIHVQSDGDLLMASASHDKYVRLWKFSKTEPTFGKKVTSVSETGELPTTLSAKVQTVSVLDAKYSITFEALLLGHEDWVYTATWKPNSDPPQLLTASADGSLAIWEPDPTSGIWVSGSRLGEISGQKGATTATGSSGGFWNGLWSPDGNSVTCLGRTGSWRLWHFDESRQYWIQKPAVGGHTSSVNGLVWPSDGSYLLSTSSDQTTRLHAEWRQSSKRTWHEFARPQIHGYDLNCIASTSNHQFSSGADEKLLRVFDEPKAIADMLHKLCKIEISTDSVLPDTAAIPVLGLSNKAMDENQTTENGDGMEDDREVVTTNGTSPILQDLEDPPTEDVLSRHTLWPEHEKLYGHGYEISEAASNGQILATACKASSLDHAVIRLYDTQDWREIKPVLQAHTLTVTRLVWSPSPDNFLLSVGRDRQWAVFQPSATNNWELMQSNPKAHTRMILDAAWSPVASNRFFVTAGRDKSVKIWHRPKDNTEFVLAQTISRKSPVTSVALTASLTQIHACLAAGEEDGTISIHVWNISDASSPIRSLDLDLASCPSKAVNRLCWRPNQSKYSDDGPGHQLAIASADCSTRVIRIDLEAMCKEI